MLSRAEMRYLVITLGLLLAGMLFLGVLAVGASGASENSTSPTYTFTINFNTGQVWAGDVEYVPKPQTWKSLYEIKEFLATDNTDKLQYIPNKFTCYNFASNLQSNAAMAGRKLDIELLTPEEYRKYYYQSIGDADYHAVVTARCGNIIYWIEPQWDKIIHTSRLDVYGGTRGG